jgi:hypothetical protein
MKTILCSYLVLSNLWFQIWYYIMVYFHGSTGVVGLGLLINEVPSSHSVGLLRTSDRLVTKASTWQHTTVTRDRHLCNGGIRIRNPKKRAAAHPRLRPRGHRDRLSILYTTLIKIRSDRLTNHGQTNCININGNIYYLTFYFLRIPVKWDNLQVTCSI